MNGGAIAARDDANHRRIRRQRTLAFRGKQPFGRQTLLETFERFEERASSYRTNVCHDELKLSSRGVHGRATDEYDARAIDEHASRAGRSGFVHDAVDGCGVAFVFEFEVRVAAGMQTHPGDFTEHTNVLRVAFDEAFQAVVEFGDGDDGRFVRATCRRPLNDGVFTAGPKFRDGVGVASTGKRNIGA